MRLSKNRRKSNADYAFDTQAGPVYRSARVTAKIAERMAAGRENPHVIEILVLQHPDTAAQKAELRVYYALNLPQAVARAAELEIRLREQGLKALLVALNPADVRISELFFRAFETLEPKMPDPVPERLLLGARKCAPTDRLAAKLECAKAGVPPIPSRRNRGTGTKARNN